MRKKYEAWVLMQVRVEFEDNEDLALIDQAYDALPIYMTGKDCEPEAVYDLKEIEE